MAAETWQQGAASYVETQVPAPEAPDRAWPDLARLMDPTDRYDHDVLGGIPPWTTLEVQALACGACRHGREADRVSLPENLVFEDMGPRLWDATGDGLPEIVVVETDITRGARLAVWSYGENGLSRLAATGFIGQTHRWLAPVGVGDFGGDGQIELAYVDRPHLRRELVFLRLQGRELVEIARAPGFTAHRIGDTAITAAQRDCGQGLELLIPDADWQRLNAVTLEQGAIAARDLGPFSPQALRQAVACR